MTAKWNVVSWVESGGRERASGGDRKVGNPFQTKQGSRPSCRDQEGRRGSEEVVLENPVFLSRGPGCRGTLWGRIKGAKYRFDLQFLTWDFS